MKTLTLLGAAALLSGCHALPYILAASLLPPLAVAVTCPNCIEDPEEGPIHRRTPEERQALRDAFAARMRDATAPRPPMLGE